jgi:hypothetical protein
VRQENATNIRRIPCFSEQKKHMADTDDRYSELSLDVIEFQCSVLILFRIWRRLMLEEFIVEAKAAAYVGNGSPEGQSRVSSHDVGYQRAPWRYLDSYFGGTDFLGQEVVWRDDLPIWAMNYYGRILDDSAIDAVIAGSIIKESLAALYRQGRFLGGFEYTAKGYKYVDQNTGAAASFLGVEQIYRGDQEVYRLDYHGGLIRP